jgi:hypothetical protein
MTEISSWGHSSTSPMSVTVSQPCSSGVLATLGFLGWVTSVPHLRLHAIGARPSIFVLLPVGRARKAATCVFQIQILRAFLTRFLALLASCRMRRRLGSDTGRRDRVGGSLQTWFSCGEEITWEHLDLPQYSPCFRLRAVFLLISSPGKRQRLSSGSWGRAIVTCDAR